MSTTKSVKRIEVVFALPGCCWREVVHIGAGATAEQVMKASGLDQVCLARTGAEPSAMGVYGRKVEPAHVVASGQRLALYRPLQVDPRERRRRRSTGGSS